MILARRITSTRFAIRSMFLKEVSDEDFRLFTPRVIILVLVHFQCSFGWVRWTIESTGRRSKLPDRSSRWSTSAGIKFAENSINNWVDSKSFVKPVFLYIHWLTILSFAQTLAWKRSLRLDQTLRKLSKLISFENVQVISDQLDQCWKNLLTVRFPLLALLPLMSFAPQGRPMDLQVRHSRRANQTNECSIENLFADGNRWIKHSFAYPANFRR